MIGVFVLDILATTEFHPFGHPLPLHDALPIASWDQARSIPPVRAAGRAHNRRTSRRSPNRSGTGRPSVPAGTPGLRGSGARPAFPRPCRASRSRSEEHTSELPSLMRISYAVFCLKKKKTKIIINQIDDL